MTATLNEPNGPTIDWEARRAAREAELLAAFDPNVPGMNADDDGKVLHTDLERGLTYRWYNISRRTQDFAMRDSGYLVSRVSVTYRTPDTAEQPGEDIEVAYLNIQHTTPELVAAEIASPFHFADENLGAAIGFRWRAERGEKVTDAQIWAGAYTNLHGTLDRPASMAGKVCWGAYSASQAPADPQVLKAEIAVAERHYAKMMRGFLRWLSVPFVDYSHVDSEYEGARVPGHPGNLRGTGVGRTMYVLAAQHLATYGKVLRASGLQSPEAQRLWDRLMADPTVPTRRTRPTFYKPSAYPNRTYPCIDFTK